MSLWVAWLARLDLNIHALGRLPLYSLGAILTFNLGRDITLMNLYPFVFGALAVWYLESRIVRPERVTTTVQPANQPPPTGRQALPFARRTNAGGFVKRNAK
jgi:hypothetical protein